MALKVLVKRDTVNNWDTAIFVPREYELVTAYDPETKEVIYKLGDGKTSWKELKKITKLNELNKFFLYSQKYPKNPSVEVYLNPFMCELVESENSIVVKDSFTRSKLND
jgi:hypothetical protein